MKKNYSLILRKIIFAFNSISVIGIAIFILYTTRKICDAYVASDFLEKVNAIPANPSALVGEILVLVAIMGISFICREKFVRENTGVYYLTLLIDFCASFFIVYRLDFNYNGILLWVFANLIAHIKDMGGKYVLAVISLLSYIGTNHGIISVSTKIFSVNDYIKVYDIGIQKVLYWLYNLLTSLNIILFFVFCVFIIIEQSGTIDEVKKLYFKLSQTNEELQQANEKLQEYAVMKEKMGETKERNRLAREIHDTLGHTLTGISAGVDACIAMIDTSPEVTKGQLELISKVTRDGIKEVRRSVSELRPDSLERLNLEPAIRKMVNETNSITNTKIHFECDVEKLKFDEDEENAIYRVVQESMTNSVRHSHAKNVYITIKKKYSDIYISIKDDGIGCTDMKKGFGTRHIVERIKLLNGTVEFDGSDGFTTNVVIPIRWVKNMIKVLIADDQELIRQSLSIVLNTKEGIEVTDTVANGQEVIASVRKNRPDVILMDIRMPKMDGVQCTKIIKDNYSEIKIIILTTFDDDEYVYNALKWGASGYLLKGVSMDGLTNAIRTVYSGQAMINPDIATKVVRLFSQMAKADYVVDVDQKRTENLTKTEWKIINEVGRGSSNKEIAENLNLSEGTVRNYLSGILNKLEFRDRTQLAIWAVQNKVATKITEQ